MRPVTSSPVLVTYATMTGSTVGVAEAIGATLRYAGLSVEVRPIASVPSVAPYGAVVIGSAIQSKQWLPEALEFVAQHRAMLNTKPLATFLVCMTLAMNHGQYLEQVKEFMAPVRALVTPEFEGYFAGFLAIDKIPSWQARIGFRASVAVGVWSEGDHRDWDAIGTWAQTVANSWEHVKI